MNLKKLKVPDMKRHAPLGARLRRVKRFAGRGAKLTRNILAYQIPLGVVGRFIDPISQNERTQAADDYIRMDAVPAVLIASRFVREQIAIRPRMRLFVFTTLVLIFVLMLAGRGVEALQAKKPEIKVNGQAILVAQDKPNDEDAQIEARVSYKETPFDFKMPVNGYISQGYRGYHRAIDIATGAVGVPIKALGKGKVEFAGYLPDGKGNVVIVDHGDGLKSLYAHMGRIKVAVGNQVDSNTALGTVGLTGYTTGAHVHLEIIDNNIAVDPEKVLPNKENDS